MTLPRRLRILLSTAALTLALACPPAASAASAASAGSTADSTAVTANAALQKPPLGSRTTIGLESGYVSRNTSAYVGVYMRYRFSRVFALKPRFDFLIRHHDCDGYMVNIDGHFSIPLRTDRWEIFGILGGGFTSWSMKEQHPTPQGDVEIVRNRHGGLGLDAGAGVSFNVTPTLRFALEGKANIMKGYTSALAGLSIGFNF